MSTVNSVDLSNVVLILGSFVGVDNLLGLSENSRYEFLPPGDADGSWKGDQPEREFKPPLLYLEMGKHLFDPQGWVFGSHSDSDQCDLQLAKNNQTGISRRLLRVDISPVTHNPRVTALSDGKVHIRDGDRILTCRPRAPQEFSRPVTFDLGAVSFLAWVPKRTAAEGREYKKKAKKFSEDILRAVPKYMPSIQTQPETAKHNVRYGRKGAVYVSEWGVAGKGMCASVMMVKESTTGKIFGAKEPYYKTNSDHDAARKRFEELQKEYEHIMQLDHPHIVTAYDLVLAEDVTLPPWMIIEYIPHSLFETLNDLGEHDKPMVLIHLSSALHYMHGRGITHRDVKPDNALVYKRDQTLTIKLADFGTSTSSRGKMDTMTGTEIYMAPELFEKPRRYTNKVDIWSLGLIAMQLFTTWNPASDSEWNPSEFAPWMRNVILPHITEAPEQFRPLLRGLLRKDPVRRWSAGKCLEWLSMHIRADGVIIRSKKRPASTLDEDVLKADDYERRRRSPNPSVSTARARDLLPTEHHSEGSIPDTLSPGAWVPEPISAAPTPHPDDELFDDGDEPQSSSDDGSNTEFEDDWNGNVD